MNIFLKSSTGNLSLPSENILLPGSIATKNPSPAFVEKEAPTIFNSNGFSESVSVSNTINSFLPNFSASFSASFFVVISSYFDFDLSKVDAFENSSSLISCF